MKNILIVKLSAIGDVIHAMPVAAALKKKFPAAKITWVVEPPAYDLVRDNPCIDRVIVFEKKKFKSIGGFLSNIGKLKSELRREPFDLSLDLQGLFKSAAIAWLGNAQEKLGYCNMREGSDRISPPVIGKHANGHIIERYLDVARAAGCAEEPAEFPFQSTDREQEEVNSRLRQAGASPENSYVESACISRASFRCWQAAGSMMNGLPLKLPPGWKSRRSVWSGKRICASWQPFYRGHAQL